MCQDTNGPLCLLISYVDVSYKRTRYNEKNGTIFSRHLQLSFAPRFVCFGKISSGVPAVAKQNPEMYRASFPAAKDMSVGVKVIRAIGLV
jgi:hypothetical protein